MAADRLVYVSGVTGTSRASDISAQTERLLARADDELRAGGSSLAQAAAVTVYLRDAADFPAMNDAYRRAWQADPPSRTTVVADLADPDARVQMSFVGLRAGTERVAIHPSEWLRSPNPYSYAIHSGETVWCSGLIPRNGRDNTVVTGDTAAQTRAVLANAGELLATTGLTCANVVSARVFLADIDDFAIMTAEYGRFFGSTFPARATVQAKLTSPSYKVEMTFVGSRAARTEVGARDPDNPTVTPAVRAGTRLYLAGIPGAAADEVLDGLDRRLSEAGYQRRDVVDLLVYLRDVRSWERVRAALVAYFGGCLPACTAVQATLAAGFEVEIMASAERG